ncbi:MAG: TerB N-terminal domain-containing protein [Thermoplasmata archaeon]|nr:TerB N-terminal domain-containing protein [Thermoplasmata archaeon]
MPYWVQFPGILHFTTDEFIESMERYRDAEGVPCKAVPSSFLNPIHSKMSEQSLQFYLWWREAARRGKVLTDDRGYAWLYVAELLNSDEGPRDVLDRLVEFYTAAGDMNCTRVIQFVVEDYAKFHGFPTRELPRNGRMHLSTEALTDDLLGYPITVNFPRDILGHQDYDWSDVSDLTADQMTEAMVRFVRGLDELTRTTYGLGFMSAIGSVMEGGDYTPFEVFPYRWDRHDVGYADATSEGCVFDMFMDAAVKEAASHTRRKGRRALSVPDCLLPEYREIVDAAVDSVLSGADWDPAAWRRSDIGFWGRETLPYADDGGDAADELLDSCHVLDQRMPVRTKPDIDPGDLMSHWSERSHEHPAYVPSGRLMPDYRRMDEDQTAYYISWRTYAMEGVYTDTDSGYLWLYLTELVNCAEDPAWAQGRIEELAHVFVPDGFDTRGMFYDTMVDHAVEHGLPISETVLGQLEGRCAAYLVLESDPVRPLRMHHVINMSECDLHPYIDYDDIGTYDRAVLAAVRAVDSAMARKGKRLVDLAGRSDEFLKRRLYAHLWYPEKRIATLRYRNISTKRLMHMMECIAKTVISRINRSKGRRAPRIPEDFPEEYRAAAEAAVVEIMGTGDSRAVAEKRARPLALMVRIDMGAVESAERDLAAVTGMMAVREEEPEQDAVVPDVPVSKGWDAFIASLDQAEAAFLADALTSKGAKASYSGRRRGELEESVNSKAMDAVGDAVVEDGRAVEDYRGELERIVARTRA